MIKQMAVVTRRPDMTHEEYVNYVKHIHGYQITCGNPLQVSRYIQNYVFDAAYGARSDLHTGGYQIVYQRDSVTELYFADEDAMMQTFAHPYVHEVIGPDGANFSNLDTSLPFLVQEQEIDVPHPAAGGIKIFYMIKGNDNYAPDEITRLWLQGHHEVVERNVTVRQQLRKCIHNVQISAGDANYFGSKENVRYDVLATFWFDTTAAFRTYQQELVHYAQQHGDFIDPSYSFFLYTDALTIYDAGASLS
ncbi:EthD domain-containing protein [Paenibacillus sp. WLX2291]|uniref:EthD domain-containing protein n=1 Tax=Paenibacillus sp. WLX2291 TaxID=3296934 RepID=UPI00398450CD